MTQEMDGRSLTKHYRVGITSLAVLLLWVGVPVAGDEQPTTATTNTGAELRLVYVFDPAIDAHFERALQLQSLSFAPSLISVMGVVRDSDNSSVRRSRDIEFDTVPERFARAENIGGRQVSSWLASTPGPHEDYFVLEDETGVRLQGAGSDLGQVAAVVPVTPVLTKVEFNTWGKVKELFQ